MHTSHWVTNNLHSMFSARILWAVKILLVLHKASEAGTPLMKGRELQAACVGPDTDTYMYRRTLRELAAKTDYLICVFQSGRTFYQWNPNHRPTLPRPDPQAGRRHA